jgi:hypothetical protein
MSGVLKSKTEPKSIPENVKDTEIYSKVKAATTIQ